MKEYIEKDKALAVLMQNGADVGTRKDIMELPAADVVEVVRCRDCKHYAGRLECWELQGKGMIATHEEGYCSYAERKEG